MYWRSTRLKIGCAICAPCASLTSCAILISCAQVAYLCQAVRLLRLELFALRNEERAYGDMLGLVADQVGLYLDFMCVYSFFLFLCVFVYVFLYVYAAKHIPKEVFRHLIRTLGITACFSGHQTPITCAAHFPPMCCWFLCTHRSSATQTSRSQPRRWTRSSSAPGAAPERCSPSPAWLCPLQ